MPFWVAALAFWGTAIAVGVAACLLEGWRQASRGGYATGGRVTPAIPRPDYHHLPLLPSWDVEANLLRLYQAVVASNTPAQVVQEIDRMVSHLSGPPESTQRDEQLNGVWITRGARRIFYSDHMMQCNPAITEALAVWDHYLEGTLEQERIHERAWKLLEDNLTPKQRRDLERRSYFFVNGGDTGMRYRISKGVVSNITLFADGQPVERLCVAPEITRVLGDVMLAQKIGLECYESETLARANRTVLGGVACYGTHEDLNYSGVVYEEDQVVVSELCWTSTFHRGMSLSPLRGGPFPPD